ncbi:MAG: hypothetical protein AAF329_11810 [Cyanobacteria bacterium P01_A01_bin.17]
MNGWCCCGGCGGQQYDSVDQRGAAGDPSAAVAVLLRERRGAEPRAGQTPSPLPPRLCPEEEALCPHREGPQKKEAEDVPSGPGALARQSHPLRRQSVPL